MTIHSNSRQHYSQIQPKTSKIDRSVVLLLWQEFATWSVVVFF